MTTMMMTVIETQFMLRNSINRSASMQHQLLFGVVEHSCYLTDNFRTDYNSIDITSFDFCL